MPLIMSQAEKGPKHPVPHGLVDFIKQEIDTVSNLADRGYTTVQFGRGEWRDLPNTSRPVRTPYALVFRRPDETTATLDTHDVKLPDGTIVRSVGIVCDYSFFRSDYPALKIAEQSGVALSPEQHDIGTVLEMTRQVQIVPNAEPNIISMDEWRQRPRESQ